jgi:hypothetical protein
MAAIYHARGWLWGMKFRAFGACAGRPWPRTGDCPYKFSLSMIPKSGYRFSDKIMLKQEAR